MRPSTSTEDNLKRIRLLVVDDHELVRIGLRAVAESEKDMAVVADYGNA